MSPPGVVVCLIIPVLVCGVTANSHVALPTVEQYRHLLASLYGGNGSLLQLLEPATSPPPCSQLTDKADQSVCQSVSQCLTPDQLTELVRERPPGDAPERVLTGLCPALLFQHIIPGCVDSDSHSQHSHTRRKPRPIEVWGYGLLFVSIISLLSVLAVVLLPLIGRRRFESLMPSMVGLAAGSLAATALFYLIPDAFALSPAPGDHRYLNTALVVLLGTWMFFMLERCMKLILHYKMRSSAGGCAADPALASGSSCSSDLVKHEVGHVTSDGDAGTRVSQEAIGSSFGQVNEKPRSSHQHSRALARISPPSGIATVAWMIICGDSLHNLLDGLSIGAAFSDNVLTGISVSLAVICEELPHELGDFAVLLESGMTVKQAVYYNFASACTCYVGFVLGVLLGDFTESATFIFALAGGMFLYISLVDMVPEMNEAAEKASAVSLSHGLYVIFLQNVGIFVGCFALYSLAYYESSFSLGS